MTVREIKSEATERLAVNRYQAMLVYGIVFCLVLNLAVVIGLVTVISQQINRVLSIVLFWYGFVLLIVMFVLVAPLSYSLTDFYLKSYKCQSVKAKSLFDGFNKYNLERSIILHLIKTGLGLLFTILLIVPGVIFYLRSSMAYYLLRANAKMKPMQAIKASNKIMKGNTGKLFVLWLSFLGWVFFGIVTLGLGFIWVTPYFHSAKTVFYKRILQGDKTVYDAADEEESVSEGEEDEKNVAARLMKLQLTTEIENLDKKLKSQEKQLQSKERETKDATAPRQVSKPLDNFVPKIPEGVKPITNPMSALDNFAADSGQIFDDEIVSVNQLISEPGDDVKEVALPVVNSRDVEKSGQTVARAVGTESSATGKESLKAEAPVKAETPAPVAEAGRRETPAQTPTEEPAPAAPVREAVRPESAAGHAHERPARPDAQAQRQKTVTHEILQPVYPEGKEKSKNIEITEDGAGDSRSAAREEIRRRIEQMRLERERGAGGARPSRPDQKKTNIEINEDKK